ncbi:uncharacterized protein LMH87_007915 [Akanthomyces muscarius]|uniref:Beta-hexosaminidase n=1 Tax=Akanthomyces muscarius TaxID=2231603 RepID=A0A9W8QK83_AKAMU|nr:uncharacterized protein LMH87_007915 [Akanthomyces muscarius]KAJ4159980.1 hypothetical protein LMH87_007915 [Akanthomyces muscarius]
MKLFVLSALTCVAAALWPVPKSLETGNDTVWISKDIQVSYRHGNNSFNFDFGKGQDNGHDEVTVRAVVRGAISRALGNIFNEGLIPWKLVARNELANHEPSASTDKTYIRKLSIIQTAVANDSSLIGPSNESYALRIDADGTASITAAAPAGILRALQTFTQLFYQHSSKRGSYTRLAPVRITDAPQFSHRGLNLDVARNFYPVKDVLRTIDALSWNKLNVLHLHMTDSQSWPMEVPALPDLAGKGAYYPGMSYTPQDIESIQKYALHRGVTVHIEFDMPGHTTAVSWGYPELVAAAEAQPRAKYCAEPPCGTLQLNNPTVDRFLDTLFDDVMPRVAPYASYFHTGGDEVNAEAYTLDPTMRTSDKSKIQAQIQKMVDRNHAHVRKAGLTPIVWEEMLLDWNLTLPRDVVVQTWRGDVAIAETVKQGYKALVGNKASWYLSCGMGSWYNAANGAEFRQQYPFNDYCSPVKNWRLVYAFDPLAGVPANLTQLVLGGEVHLWSEQADGVNVDGLLWPRTAAAAEVLWSGRHDATGQNRSQVDAAPRLAEMRERMVLGGVQAGPVQMVFCTQKDARECVF